MYLVDTNVLSEARRGRPEARDWLRSVDPDQVFLSVVTLGEIMKGISQKTRTDAAAAVSLHRWLEQLRVDHARWILPISDEVALEWCRAEGLSAWERGRGERGEQGRARAGRRIR